MSEQPEAIKLNRITIKTESVSRWFDAPQVSNNPRCAENMYLKDLEVDKTLALTQCFLAQTIR